mmetsp:Transcript_5245/g.12902  ORF Transcript_5245/g.12902 Transcript_5245/m.12902 type:complete len:222 (-) Transcript_5245:116-781(-)
MDLNVSSKSRVAQNAGRRLPSQVGRNSAGFPLEEEFSHGRLRAACRTNVFVSRRNFHVPTGTRQPYSVAAPLPGRIVGARQDVSPGVFAEGDLPTTTTRRDIGFPAERTRKDLHVPSLGSTGECTRWMGTRKAAVIGVVPPAVFCGRIGIALGTNVVPIAFVAVAPCHGNYLKIANGTFYGCLVAVAVVVIIVVASVFGRLWTELTFPGHDVSFLASVAKQ